MFRQYKSSTMKQFLSFIALLFTTTCFAQNVAINNSGSTADASAMLDISSNNKGVLVPRMQTIERIAIVNPAEGLLVFDVNSRSFWYYSIGNWQEIQKSGGVVTGLASGDLSGNYPSPTVAKIQNLDVAFGVPFDKQILKWDMLNNKWQGSNDSLFLPYKATFSDPDKLFSVTNTSLANSGASIHGKRTSAGSGLTPAFSMGVWGENSNGAGIVGTSNTGIGTYGFSLQNYGVYGYTSGIGVAGVYGSHANAGGIALMGEMGFNGTAIYGKMTGDNGKSGLFETTSSAHNDTTVKAITAGTGILSAYRITNTANTKPAIDIQHAGNGNGIKVRLNNTSGVANAIDVVSQNSGVGIYSNSVNGVAGKFENTNAANTYPAMMIGTNSTGTALYVSSSNAGVTGGAIDVLGQGFGPGINVTTTKGRAMDLSVIDAASVNEVIRTTNSGDGTGTYFKTSNVLNTNPASIIEHAGKGRGLEVRLTNNTNVLAALHVNTSGNRALEVVSAGAYGTISYAAANNAIGVNGYTGVNSDNCIGVKGESGVNGNNGIGVLGIAGVNDNNGIGVKGTNSSDAHGAVTGINDGSGGGVHGVASGNFGYGVLGEAGNFGAGGKFIAYGASSQSNAIWGLNYGLGATLELTINNDDNDSPAITVSHNGTGKLASLKNSGGEMISFSNAGNIKTAGTVTVKNNKGIVRNSTASQMRYETITTPLMVSAAIGAGGVSVSVSFSTAFSSAPVVYVGNINTGFSGTADRLRTVITNVTATGCTFTVFNYDLAAFPFSATWNLVAIGVE
jgi:hypothetical protein